MEAFSAFGAFWHMGDPEESALSGRLTFDPVEGARVNLVGTYGSPTEALQEDERSAMVNLLGWLEGKPVTLINCYRSQGPIRSSGVSETQYTINQLFRGAHLVEEKLEFHRAYLRASGGVDWVGRRIASNRSNARSVQPAPWLNYVEPERETAKFSRGEVAVGYSWKSSSATSVGKVQFEHWPVFSITYDNAADFASIREDVGRIDDLITFCTDQVSSIEELSIARDDIKVRLLSGEYSDHLQTVEYIAPQISDKPWKQRHQHQMLLTYDELGGVSAIARWLDIVPSFSRSLDSLMSVRRVERIFGENRFLNVAFAAESFHRDIYGGQSLSAEDFESLTARCLAATDIAHVEWLRARLKYANETTLRERLRGLWDVSGREVLPFVEHPNRWVSVIAGVRNALTHISSSRAHFEGSDLFFLSESVYALLRACMLNEIGVSPKVFAERSVNYSFSWYAPRLNEAIERLRRKV